MKTVEEFFTANPLGHSIIENKTIKGLERFNLWLPTECNSIWACSLATFTTDPPLTYWNDEIVNKALEILEFDPERTAKALICREHDINNAIDNLFRVYERKFFEESLDLGKTADILRLANEIHPDYLMISQHIFGNLLSVYWSVLKKGGVDGNFDLLGAINILRNKQADLLIGGYDDKIRNAIAHGQVYFRGIGVQYGEQKFKYELSPFEFFDRYDLLWRVSVSLTLALILFLARHGKGIAVKYPLGINRILASSSVDRPDFQIKDYAVSELGNRGKQLHVLVKTTNLSRIAIIMDCLHFAIRMYQLNESAFSRILFDVNYVKLTIYGLLAIDFEKLQGLLKTNAFYNRFGEVIESNLLWYDEPIKVHLYKTFFRILGINGQNAYRRFIRKQNEKHSILPPNTYQIKEVKNSSAGRLARLTITAVLSNPSDVSNSEKIKMVCRSIARKYAFNWTAINPSKLVKRENFYLPPSYIWIYLYKRDGTLRWLNSSGWMNRELICVAEFIRGRRLPILVKQPDVVEKEIRYQFSMKTPNPPSEKRTSI